MTANLFGPGRNCTVCGLPLQEGDEGYLLHMDTCSDATVRPSARPTTATTIIAGHIRGCRTQGGSVSPSKCPKCSRNVEWKYRSALARLDSRAGGR